MAEKDVQKFIATISEQLVILAGQLTELRASVNVLKVIEATRLSPDDPLEALKQLRVLEKKILDSDPHEKERKEASEIIEAVKLWKKQGGGHHES
jgi:hypothetical protein